MEKWIRILTSFQVTGSLVYDKTLKKAAQGSLILWDF
jgi:hypothetical protein